MSVNIFGSRSKNKPTIDSSINSKFITLSKQLQTKVDKTGDTLSGNLCMGDNKITCLADPISDNDATNKMFVDSKLKQESIVTKLYIDTLLHQKLDRETYENSCKIFEIYKQISTQNNGISIENLLKLGDVVSDLFNENKSDDILNSYRLEFSNKIYNASTVFSKFKELFQEDSEFIHSCTLFLDLKIIIIVIIEILHEDMFLNLKNNLMAANLVSTPEDKTLRKKYRRFINKNVKSIDPTRSDQNLELLVQKNLLFLDLGFTYLIDSLLKRMLRNLI